MSHDIIITVATRIFSSARADLISHDNEGKKINKMTRWNSVDDYVGVQMYVYSNEQQTLDRAKQGERENDVREKKCQEYSLVMV